MKKITNYIYFNKSLFLLFLIHANFNRKDFFSIVVFILYMLFLLVILYSVKKQKKNQETEKIEKTQKTKKTKSIDIVRLEKMPNNDEKPKEDNKIDSNKFIVMILLLQLQVIFNCYLYWTDLCLIIQNTEIITKLIPILLLLLCLFLFVCVQLERIDIIYKFLKIANYMLLFINCISIQFYFGKLPECGVFYENILIKIISRNILINKDDKEIKEDIENKELNYKKPSNNLLIKIVITAFVITAFWSSNWK